MSEGSNVTDSKLSHAMRTLHRTAHSGKEIPAEWGWHFRTLLALRDHLAGQVGDRLREPFDAMGSPSMHAEDLSDELYDRELAQALPADRTEAMRAVNDALRRLNDGTYGRSEGTGRRIPPSQMRAMPWRRYAEAELRTVRHAFRA